MRHRRPPPATADQLAAVRIDILERQVRDLSVATVRASAESRTQAAIIRRRNMEIARLVLLLRWLLATLAPARRADPTDRVLDTGTPGVEVTR